MTFRSVTQARWFDHANGVNPPEAMRDWLTDRASLTIKLMAHSKRFRVQKLRQGHGMSLADEYAAVLLPRPMKVREREVLLRCDEQPVVYAHTIVPLAASASDWPFFNALGERSLGTTLFGDPAVKRGRLQYARLRPQHPLVRRACKAVGIDSVKVQGWFFARRCLYQRRSGVLLVTEVFLPAIADMSKPGQGVADALIAHFPAIEESSNEITI